ncbi:cytochrome P450 [Auricularia subglabra TFB-10046 SS5]|uniref:Cytochrome P450 n=1 Tax=Auricularia subglabra (strain TFB-10046 / SS5) TaxID=717982 RepID=J0WNW5_AURST|nr:cytochrome P450 [Auricularia subglabra TFB-10046 SS5]
MPTTLCASRAFYCGLKERAGMKYLKRPAYQRSGLARGYTLKTPNARSTPDKCQSQRRAVIVFAQIHSHQYTDGLSLLRDWLVETRRSCSPKSPGIMVIHTPVRTPTYSAAENSPSALALMISSKPFQSPAEKTQEILAPRSFFHLALPKSNNQSHWSICATQHATRRAAGDDKVVRLRVGEPEASGDHLLGHSAFASCMLSRLESAPDSIPCTGDAAEVETRAAPNKKARQISMLDAYSNACGEAYHAPLRSSIGWQLEQLLSEVGGSEDIQYKRLDALRGWAGDRSLGDGATSPLGRQKIPGPKRVLAVSNAWYQLSRLARRRTFNIHDLFESQKYGPVVRVGASVAAFRDVEIVKEIYRTHRFRKSSWYHCLTFGNVQNSFSTSDPTLHSRCRKFNAPAFQPDNLRTAGTVLNSQMDDLAMRLRTDCEGGQYIDMIQLFPRLSLDILGLTVIGARFDQIATGKDHEFAKLMLLPPCLSVILLADGVMTDYAKKMYDEADADKDNERSDMMYKYKTYRDPDTGESVPLPLIISDIGVFMTAGMETTAMSFVYMAYGLARDEKMWATLREELNTIDYSDPHHVEALRGLQYLDALNMEILRVYGPVSVFLERVGPAEGAELAGYHIPGGCMKRAQELMQRPGLLIGGQAYSAHRGERIFPNAHIVDPLRWVRQELETGKWLQREDVTPEMHASMFLHESTTPDSMRSVEVGSLRPNLGRCLENEPIPALAGRLSAKA